MLQVDELESVLGRAEAQLGEARLEIATLARANEVHIAHTARTEQTRVEASARADLSEVEVRRISSSAQEASERSDTKCDPAPITPTAPSHAHAATRLELTIGVLGRVGEL